MRQIREQLTAREYAEMEYQEKMLDKQLSHQTEMKQLEIEVMKLEAKWGSWMKIPITLIKLPLYILMVIPLSIYAGRKETVPEDYWRILR